MKPVSELSMTVRFVLLTAQCLLITAMLGGVLFMSSGNLFWTQAWIFLAVYGICCWISNYLLFMKAPELPDARRKKQ